MTTVTDNRSLPRDALRTRIYDAAIAAFRAHGFSKTTVEAITLRAGVAKGTFFNFYKTKFDVLAEYYWTIDARLEPLRLGLDPADPLQSLIDYAARVDDEFAREGDLIVDLIVESMRNDTMRKMDEDSGGTDAKQFATFFGKARKLGTVRKSLNPDEAADLLIDVWAGAVRAWLACDRRHALDTIFIKRLAVLFRGFEPERKR